MSLAVTILELLTILPLKLDFVSEVWWDKGAYMLVVVLPCPLPRLPTSYLVEMGSWPPAPSPDPGILAVLCRLDPGVGMGRIVLHRVVSDLVWRITLVPEGVQH